MSMNVSVEADVEEKIVLLKQRIQQYREHVQEWMKKCQERLEQQEAIIEHFQERAKKDQERLKQQEAKLRRYEEQLKQYRKKWQLREEDDVFEQETELSYMQPFRQQAELITFYQKQIGGMEHGIPSPMVSHPFLRQHQIPIQAAWLQSLKKR